MRDCDLNQSRSSQEEAVMTRALRENVVYVRTWKINGVIIQENFHKFGGTNKTNVRSVMVRVRKNIVCTSVKDDTMSDCNQKMKSYVMSR